MTAFLIILGLAILGLICEIQAGRRRHGLAWMILASLFYAAALICLLAVMLPILGY